jgi:hypothetical protein
MGRKDILAWGIYKGIPMQLLMKDMDVKENGWQDFSLKNCSQRCGNRMISWM